MSYADIVPSNRKISQGVTRNVTVHAFARIIELPQRSYAGTPPLQHGAAVHRPIAMDDRQGGKTQSRPVVSRNGCSTPPDLSHASGG